MQAEGRTELTTAFRNFANAPKKYPITDLDTLLGLQEVEAAIIEAESTPGP